MLWGRFTPSAVACVSFFTSLAGRLETIPFVSYGNGWPAPRPALAADDGAPATSKEKNKSNRRNHFVILKGSPPDLISESPVWASKKRGVVASRSETQSNDE
jgi:hypothetical protein